MESVYEYNLEDLEKAMVDINEKKYRAKQIFDWLYVKKVNKFSDMTNLNKESINNISSYLFVEELAIVKKQEDKDVKKYLFKLSDNEYIEAVLMYQYYGISICISTQVGCLMGCAFCESGRLKKRRNLTTSELVSQIIAVEKDIGKRISHIVLMGIGEPFDNYDNVCKFITIINNPHGLNVGSRHITVSTCGIVPKIKELIDFPYQINLAISLHAPNDEIRNKLMPINKIYNIKTLLETIKEYISKTNRRVTFEYIMLDGINDSSSSAKELALLLSGINCYVNLIPYNATNNLTYKRSDDLSISNFYDILKKEGINVTTRKEFGSKISAACGQLRSSEE